MGTSSDDWALRWILESQDSTHMEVLLFAKRKLFHSNLYALIILRLYIIIVHLIQANHKRALKAEILNAIMNKEEFVKVQQKFSTLEIAKSPKKGAGITPAPVTAGSANRMYGHMPGNPDPSNPLNMYSAPGQLPPPPTAAEQTLNKLLVASGPTPAPASMYGSNAANMPGSYSANVINPGVTSSMPAGVISANPNAPQPAPPPGYGGTPAAPAPVPMSSTYPMSTYPSASASASGARTGRRNIP